MARGTLFDPDIPPGFEYRNDFISPDEEADLTAQTARLDFANFEMRGVIARRRVAFFGRSYDSGRAATPPIPAFLLPLRNRIAEWAQVDAGAFVMALVNEYAPGAPIGWHRDAPQYGIVGGLSLLSACRMRFRPYVSPGALATSALGRRTSTHEITLERRSAYLMTGPARDAYEHHIPPVASLRYSITFRTARP